MDEDVTSLIQRACELARNLELNLPSESRDSILRCIDEIVAKLNAAKGKLMAVSSSRDEEAAKQEIIQQHPYMASSSASSFLQEWLSANNRFVQIPQLQAPAMTAAPPRGTLQMMTDLGARDVDASAEGDVEASPSSRRRKRKDDAEKMTFTVQAVQLGNSDSVPPDDGYTWRKYGQKEILGSNYPRSYFRCTHLKLYHCLAKKQVQRLDNNPNMFAVTYRGSHTCHMSSTAPSPSVPPPHLMISQPQDIAHISTTSSSQLSPSSASVPGWLPSVHLGLLARGGSGGGVTQAGAEAGGAGPSTSRFGADYPVADMAMDMFHSGSSSGNNSMESLFASADEKNEAGDNKKS
ncbi:WRKY transcription factor 55-like isoform X2 [Neltuma alba]|uniref:WRKY transcription factor 55-like isoform X2 n=1 Tax=Neltuma alba TaxID=207710 RepID=UPI0010A4C420|nr:WRKY transcription factor 55-like isoform X2 [Prosopis alba]